MAFYKDTDTWTNIFAGSTGSGNSGNMEDTEKETDVEKDNEKEVEDTKEEKTDKEDKNKEE